MRAYSGNPISYLLASALPFSLMAASGIVTQVANLATRRKVGLSFGYRNSKRMLRVIGWLRERYGKQDGKSSECGSVSSRGTARFGRSGELNER